MSEIKGVKDPTRRQIFYFDDFLGTTALDKMQKNEDKRLVEFMDEVKTNDNWRFILTTREYILNAAKLRYESLARPDVDLTPCIIELADYTQPIRAKILYNHIYFSDLPDAYKRALLEERHYEKIIQHQNYNPRIVEYMTRDKYLKGIPVSAYSETFLRNLANPMMVWDHAFRNQLSEAGQHLVLVMGTLGDEVRFCDLEAAFQAFYSYRQRKLGFTTRSRDFDNAVKELDGNFIKTSLIGRDRVVTLHNPSLSDFLEYYFAETPADLTDLVESATFFNQFINLWRGRRGKRYSAFDGAGGDHLLQMVGSRLMCPSCNFIRVKTGKGDEYFGVRVEQMSFEQRLSYVIEINEVINTPGARRLREGLLDQLQSQLLSRRGSKQHLVFLLKKLATLGKDPEKLGPLLEAAKSYLLNGIDVSDLEEFEALAKFVENFPEIMRTDELKQAREQFLDFAKDYDESWADSPDDYRYIAESLARVAEMLEVDVSERCSDLENRASEWDESLDRSHEAREENDDDEESYSRSQSNPDDTTTMFDDLLDELRERDS